MLFSLYMVIVLKNMRELGVLMQCMNNIMTRLNLTIQVIAVDCDSHAYSPAGKIF